MEATHTYCGRKVAKHTHALFNKFAFTRFPEYLEILVILFINSCFVYFFSNMCRSMGKAGNHQI